MSFINIYRNYFIKYNLYFIKIKISLETKKFLSKNGNFFRKIGHFFRKIGHFFRKIGNFSQSNNILLFHYHNLYILSLIFRIKINQFFIKLLNIIQFSFFDD